jgi:beta-fructofuranosidase
VFVLPDTWTWDFWLADTGAEYHLFFLRASRALLDPDRRHLRASIGHAVSRDLVNWTLLADAVVASDSPAWDDQATWTGSVVQDDDGRWHMFYTGVSRSERGLVQRIGVATSTDLMVWQRDTGGPLLHADPTWYERLPDEGWHDEAWRDPWVFRDPSGDGWHMLVTARCRTGDLDDRGVIAHARSADLRDWRVQPPLSSPGSGFGQLEVPQVEVVDGQPVLMFSCLRGDLAASRRATGTTGGVWAVACDAVTGPYDIARACEVTDHGLYSGRLIRDRSGRWVMLAFHNVGQEGQFEGWLSDPMPVRLEHGVLVADRQSSGRAASLARSGAERHNDMSSAG